MFPVSAIVPVGIFTYGLLKKDSISKREGLIVGAGIAGSAAITIGMKYVINRERPFKAYPLHFQNKDVGGGPSFPSGHTSSAFATATSLTLFHPKWYIIAPSFLWATAVGYSRMELGVHYPSDVLVGAILGAGCAWLCWKINGKD